MFERADRNGDGKVNVADMQVLLAEANQDASELRAKETMHAVAQEAARSLEGGRGGGGHGGKPAVKLVDNHLGAVEHVTFDEFSAWCVEFFSHYRPWPFPLFVMVLVCKLLSIFLF